LKYLLSPAPLFLEAGAAWQWLQLA
jgi:hypothetical protein